MNCIVVYCGLGLWQDSGSIEIRKVGTCRVVVVEQLGTYNILALKQRLAMITKFQCNEPQHAWG